MRTLKLFYPALIACLADRALSEVGDELLHPVDPTDWLTECVPPFKERGFAQNIWYSNYYLDEKPNGLCADFLSCAFEQCTLYPEAIQVLNDTNLESTTYDEIKDKLPPLNLPSHISFPKSVKDVVQVVKYAASQCLSITIKNAGHSYAGSSSLAGSIQLALREFPRYSRDSIVECRSEQQPQVDDDSMSSPCKLALARGKPATIRVGGGERWDDVYRAVLDYPDEASGESKQQKYDVVGGGAGTVSSIGGWMQGGGESIGDERMYGFGVDQVLELEMIVADGTHVKFGPTEWEDTEGFLYPKTTKVEGMCNMNVDENENLWDWQPCAENSAIPFDKLWFAVRGGGGGTYGIVTAAHYQLHPHKPLYVMTIPPEAGASLVQNCTLQANCEEADAAIVFFLVDLFFNPAEIGLDEETSNSCGHPGMVFELSRFGNFFCRDPDKVLESWKNYVEVLPQSLDGLKNDLVRFFASINVGSYAKQGISQGELAPVGRINDYPPPSTYTDTIGCWSALIPKEFLMNKTIVLYQLLKFLPDAHVIGGKTSVAHDQMTSLNPIQRQAGLQTCIYDRQLEAWARGLLLPYWPSADGKFPGGTEYNHISNFLNGPMKSNWSEPCPIDMPVEEQKEKCVSIEESVWGTELLSELKVIKKQVDPHNMFKCYRCVGFEDEGATCTPEGTDASAPTPTTTSGGAGRSDSAIGALTSLLCLVQFIF